MSRKYRVRLLPIAEEDLDQILAFVGADNVTAALDLVERIERQLAALANFPNLGRVPRDDDLRNTGYRYLVIDDYLAFYTVDNRTVTVHRIVHAARDYKGLL